MLNRSLIFVAAHTMAKNCAKVHGGSSQDFFRFCLKHAYKLAKERAQLGKTVCYKCHTVKHDVNMCLPAVKCSTCGTHYNVETSTVLGLIETPNRRHILSVTYVSLERKKRWAVSTYIKHGSKMDEYRYYSQVNHKTPSEAWNYMRELQEVYLKVGDDVALLIGEYEVRGTVTLDTLRRVKIKLTAGTITLVKADMLLGFNNRHVMAEHAEIDADTMAIVQRSAE